MKILNLSHRLSRNAMIGLATLTLGLSIGIISVLYSARS